MLLIQVLIVADVTNPDEFIDILGIWSSPIGALITDALSAKQA